MNSSRLTLLVAALAVITLGACFFKKGSRMTLSLNNPAPDFSLPDKDGTLHRLSAYRGKKVALYFYPKDGTPVCTKQACNLRDNYQELKKHNIAILGISFDDEERHQTFAAKNSLTFPLLSDKDQHVAKAYGASRWLLLASIPKRKTFLINEEGVVVDIITTIDAGNHATQIINGFKK